MNPILLEMMSIYSGDPFDFIWGDEDEELAHAYEAQGKSVQGAGGRTAEASSNGIGSGRFRAGSGEHPYQHGVDFLERVDLLKKSGMTRQTDIAKAMGCRSTTDFRVEYTRHLNEWKKSRAEKAQKMLDSGMKKKDVAAQLGIRVSSLDSWLNPKSLKRINAAQTTADFLEEQVKEKRMLDVGEGVEKELGISKEKLREALVILEDKGYAIYGGRVPQATNPGMKTSLRVLAMPDEEHSDLYNHPEKIQSVKDYVCRVGENGEEHFEKKWQYPASLDSKRLMIRYADDVAPDGHTGVEKDGTIEIRRNVPDLDLKGSHYAQVRIMVDGKKYLKGMAHYSDNMPDGIDVIFNTNKTRDKADSVLKKIKDDPDNPFGALLREKGGQYTYEENGERKLGLINKTRQEGDWEDWKDSLPSQFLAKQPLPLIHKQLDLAIRNKKAEYEDIMSVTNPTVKKSLLEYFAEGCDSDAVHMSAAALPRQKYQVILPVPTLSDKEVYAPNYRHGETVALIRYPHAGQFEIVVARVNNKNAQGIEVMGKNPIDAIGVNKHNADILSGADFDGDTVMVIPCNDPDNSTTSIQHRPPLEQLENFDPKMEYGPDEPPRITKERVKQNDGSYKEVEVEHYYRNGFEFKPMTRTGLEMGKVSNLIMDMTLKGAPFDELAMAVRHSMVVIDAEKHHLDWQQSEKDNHIPELKKKWQYRVDEDGSEHTGASTLLTRAKSPIRINKPKGAPHIDPETGKLYYTESQLKPQTFVDKDGKTKTRQIEVDLLSTKDDARELISTFDKNNPDELYTRSPKEAAYAQYSNMLKAMANEARKEMVSTGDIKFNKEAEQKYHEEAEHLLAELLLSELNAPRERMAQLYARGVVLAKKEANPDMTKKEIKKASNQALANGRIKYGASRHKIDISPKEWEAIQAGAISPTKLASILKYADPDKVREYATPRQSVNLTTGQKASLRKAIDNGAATADIIERFGISISALNRIKKEMGVTPSDE